MVLFRALAVKAARHQRVMAIRLVLAATVAQAVLQTRLAAAAQPVPAVQAPTEGDQLQVPARAAAAALLAVLWVLLPLAVTAEQEVMVH